MQCRKSWICNLLLPILLLTTGLSQIPTARAETDPRRGEQELRYLGVLFGPSLSDWSAYQPDGETPVSLRSFLTWNLRLEDGWRFGVTGSWSWQPVLEQELALRDPFVKLAKPNLLRIGPVSLYSDLRVHLPITTASRNRDLWWALQSFNSIDWVAPWGSLGLYSSARYNQYGSLGEGDEWEFYVAPSVELRLSQRLAVGTLLEWGGGVPYRRETAVLFSDGFSLQPGVSWDLFPNLNLGPFLRVPLGGAARQTALGFTLSWKIDSWNLRPL